MLTKWGTAVPDGFTRQEYESLIESIPSTTVENAATNSDKLTKWGTSVPTGYTMQQYESLIERIPARTIVNAETISPGSEDAALLTDSSTMQDNSDSLGANNDISKEDRTEPLVTAQHPEPYIPLVTKWGTSVPVTLDLSSLEIDRQHPRGSFRVLRYQCLFRRGRPNA